MGDILLIKILPWKPVALRIKIKICFKKTIYVWLHWLFVALLGLSLVASRVYSSLWCTGFPLRWLLLLWSTGSRHVGFNSWSIGAQRLWFMGIVALRHVASS